MTSPRDLIAAVAPGSFLPQDDGVRPKAWTAVADLPPAVWSSTRLVAVPPGPTVLDSPWGPP